MSADTTPSTHKRPAALRGALLVDFLLVWTSLFVIHSLPRWLDGVTGHEHWYLAFLPILWISFRHGFLGAVAGVVAIVAAGLVSPQIDSAPVYELRLLCVVLSVTGLLLGSAVSSRRAAERELEQHDAELRRIEVELASKSRELGLKNSELERFIYTVSHDLRNPLLTIQGFLGLLKKDMAHDKSERVDRDLEHIQNATGTMERLLDELLELARIGRVIHTLREVDLAEVTQKAVEQVAGRIRERGIDVAIAPDLPIVMGDRDRLLQVLENLIDNAVKFMGDQPRPRIAIGWQQRGDEKVFHVRDNGVGIEPRYHQKVFGLFNRLDGSGDGTGIGLALVKRVIEEHGGRVWVESEGPGTGSTFYFTLG